MGDDRQDTEGARPEEAPHNAETKPGTVKLILDYKKGDPRDQLRDYEQLDAKLAAVFTAAVCPA